MLKIKKLYIEGVGGIRSLDIEFKEGVNIICGMNGIGKTTILDSIVAPFTSSNTNIKSLKRNALVDKGVIKISIDKDSINKDAQVIVEGIDPNSSNGGSNWYNFSKELMLFKTHRNIDYISVDSIKKDSINSNYSISSQQANEGVKSSDIKQWFVNRYMWSAHKDALTNTQKENFELAKSCFSLLDKNIEFNKVTTNTHDIKLNTESGEIYYEYLSSGHKSVLHLLLGFIKEIEYRFSGSDIMAKDFEGVILVDEIDLHLHPQWQRKIIKYMKKLFPKAQIIVTTHSPHIIQSAESDEVIALKNIKDGNLKIKELSEMKYGFQGWTVEEILQDVMGLETVQSDLYNNIMDNFEKAIDDDDYEEAKKNYEILEQMLYPQNAMLKLLKIQMAGMGN